ncbi:Gfo/Idh/MocA family protein [Maribacter sp. 2307ULW6-5]|uniref:Gfo/Idh/MocA family protein n=1 Tax=Maribacter sp. 2307ULW6-5 TaxID=3386275 RepID=UPI0039BCF49E
MFYNGKFLAVFLKTWITGLLLLCIVLGARAQQDPVRLGVAGLTHGHVGWILGREDKGDVVMVGIVETDTVLARRLAGEFGFSMDLVYASMEEMITATRPEAVAAFGSTYDHLAVVRACAPKGVHVMVEKPLAVNLDHAKKMAHLAKKHNIHLLTNYETSWYPTNIRAKELLQQGAIGDLRKVIVRDGHKGPKKIGVNKEFLAWLTDPKRNGGGALMDFGCYGANLLTWIHRGVRPNSVTAVTQQLQAENNPNVDDDATLVLAYDTSMGVVQASWNWPMGRKDMELYGTLGAVYADDRNQLRIRSAQGYDGFAEETLSLPERRPPYHDPFALLAAVVKGEEVLAPFDPYSLENNLVTMEILDAATKSARKGKTVRLR